MVVCTLVFKLIAKLMALNIGQGGEFAFVIFGIALSFKLVEQEILIMLMNQYKARDDEKEFVSTSQQGAAQLEEV